MREKDSRTMKLTNITIIKTGTVDEILTIEKEIKKAFFDETLYEQFKSTEMFPSNQKQEIIKFINSF